MVFKAADLKKKTYQKGFVGQANEPRSNQSVFYTKVHEDDNGSECRIGTAEAIMRRLPA